MNRLKNLIKIKKESMNKSIKTKLFLIMTLTIMSILGILIFVNSFIIESYYLYYKKSNLLQAYNEINKVLNSISITNSEAKLKIEKIAINNNFNIVINNKYNTTIYNSNDDFNYYLIDFSKIASENILYNKDNTYIVEARDSKSDINFLLLVGKIGNDGKIYIRMPISSIKDSVKISNNFFYSIGIITIIISGIAILIISKKFTKPISELSSIANKMANLDFSQKYRIKDTGDDVDNLGKSINTMSDKLEKTITELQNNNSELEKDIERKSKIDEMRKQFISDVSHELKTPIALIQGYSEGLLENVNSDEENRKFYAEVIQDEANKMDIMVKNLLELMKLEYGAKKLDNKHFNIVDLINEEVRKYTVMLNDNKIKVIFTLKEPVYVNADINMIEQVLNNYLSNAIKNNEEINGKKIIKITIKIIDNKVRIYVFNTGKNIPSENMEKIWNRFYKEDTSRNREMGGTGIGLSLVKAIMNNYNNEYGAINREEGVEFYFDLNM